MALRRAALPPHHGKYVDARTPQQVSAEEKVLLEKLSQSENFKPNPGKGDKNFFDRVREAFQ